MVGLVAMSINALWKRYIRLMALVPGLDIEWVADCEKHGTASFKGETVSLKNVRDFTWKGKRDYDRKWINTKVNIDEIVDTWFVIDHFHKIKGLAHTMLTFEFADGNLSHSLSKHGEKSVKSITLGMVFGVRMSCICW